MKRIGSTNIHLGPKNGVRSIIDAEVTKVRTPVLTKRGKSKATAEPILVSEFGLSKMLDCSRNKGSILVLDVSAYRCKID